MIYFDKDKIKKMSREEILSLPSIDEKLAYFDAVKIRHDRIVDKLDEFMLIAKPKAGVDIVYLIGPTGVGKSALTEIVRDKVSEKYRAEMIEDPSFIPVVIIEAPATGEKKFSWRMLYTMLGEELNEPLIDRKIETVMKDGRTTVKNVAAGSTVASLRKMVKSALKYRKTLLVIIDEAVHMFENCNAETMKHHLNALKSLSNIRGVTLALVGSYDLYKLMGLTGQSARRSTTIYMPRYMHEEESKKSFVRAIQMLQKKMPLEDVPDLVQYATFLQQTCVGCVGTMKDALSRALNLALENGGRWKDSHLERSVLPKAQVQTILQEIQEGEEEVAKHGEYKLFRDD